MLATGIWLGSQGWWSAGWFYVSVAAWVMNLLLAVLVVHRAEGKLAKAAREEAPMTAIDAIRHAPSWDLAIAAMLAADLALLWIMIVKPSTAASIGVMVGTLVIFVSIALARRGASLPAPSAAPVSD